MNRAMVQLSPGRTLPACEEAAGLADRFDECHSSRLGRRRPMALGSQPMTAAPTRLVGILAVLTALALIAPASAFSAGPALVLLGADTLDVAAKQHSSTA